MCINLFKRFTTQNEQKMSLEFGFSRCSFIATTSICIFLLLFSHSTFFGSFLPQIVFTFCINFTGFFNLKEIPGLLPFNLEEIKSMPVYQGIAATLRITNVLRLY